MRKIGNHRLHAALRRGAGLDFEAGRTVAFRPRGPGLDCAPGGGLRPSTAGPMLDLIDLSGPHGGVNAATELLWGLRNDDLDCWRGPRAGHLDGQSGGIRGDFTQGVRLYGCKIEIKAFAR